jgi:hypothetical protein
MIDIWASKSLVPTVHTAYCTVTYYLRNIISSLVTLVVFTYRYTPTQLASNIFPDKVTDPDRELASEETDSQRLKGLPLIFGFKRIQAIKNLILLHIKSFRLLHNERNLHILYGRTCKTKDSEWSF